jgi:hypothetical protein
MQRITQQLIDNYVGTGTVAELYGISDARVGQLADAGRIPCIRTAIGRLFPLDEVTVLAAAHRSKTSGGGKEQLDVESNFGKESIKPRTAKGVNLAA